MVTNSQDTNYSTGVISVLSANYHLTYGVTSAYYLPADEVISVLSVNYH